MACIRVDSIELESAVDAAREPWVFSGAGKITLGTTAIIKDLHKSFEIGSRRSRQKLHAFRGVNLELNEGEAVALVGESGCGKSTLLRCVAGLQPVHAGFVDIARGGRPQMVFQDAGASLTPWMSVGELIGERLREESLDRKTRARRVADALQVVGLPPEVGRSGPDSCQAVNASGLPWHEPPSFPPRCCSATSPPARSTFRSPGSSSI